MKQKIFLLLLIIFVTVSFPVSGYAEEWGDGSGSVRDMFDDDVPEDEDQVLQDQNGSTNGDVNSEGEEVEDDSAIEPDNDDTEVILGAGPDQNLFFLSFQMFLALAVVIFLIYALLKFINNRSRSYRSHSTMEGVGGVGLGSNRSVQLVRVGNKVYLLGVGESVNLLKEIEDPNEVEKILEEHRPQEMIDQPMVKISKWFKGNLVNRSAEKESDSFKSLFSKELKDVKDSQEKVYSALKEKEK